MEPIRTLLVNDLGARSASVAKDSRMVNAYCESFGDKKSAIKRPGLVTVTTSPTLPSGTSRGLFWAAEEVYSVINGTLYEISITPYTAPSAQAINGGQINSGGIN